MLGAQPDLQRDPNGWWRVASSRWSRGRGGSEAISQLRALIDAIRSHRQPGAAIAAAVNIVSSKRHSEVLQAMRMAR
jgi:hypothetical protein